MGLETGVAGGGGGGGVSEVLSKSKSFPTRKDCSLAGGSGGLEIVSDGPPVFSTNKRSTAESISSSNPLISFSPKTLSIFSFPRCSFGLLIKQHNFSTHVLYYQLTYFP